MKNILKTVVVIAGLSVGAVAMAAGNLPVVKMVWGTNVPTSGSITVNVETANSGCYVWSAPIKQKGSFLRKNLNNIPACAGVTSMQAMVNNPDVGVACQFNDGQINMPFNGAKEITVTITNYTQSSDQPTAICTVQYK